MDQEPEGRRTSSVVAPIDAEARVHITRAAAVLRAGGLVAFPTETVYGLGAAAAQPEAVRRIFAAKGRPADHPVILHLRLSAEIDHWAREVPATAWALAAAFWPGPLTLVLPRSVHVHDLISGGQDSVGLRCPSHPWAQALLQAFGGAVAAPSANRFGHISPTTAAHVRADLGERTEATPMGAVDVVLDGGACPVGIESTIVDLTGEVPRLLRPGSITREMLAAVLGAPVAEAGGDAPRASGRLETHYAPRTPLELVDIGALPARLALLRGQRLALLVPEGLVPDVAADSRITLHLVAPDDAAVYAQGLYTFLHELDAAGADRIVVARPPQGLAWEAVQDRLRRAAAGFI